MPVKHARHRSSIEEQFDCQIIIKSQNSEQRFKSVLDKIDMKRKIAYITVILLIVGLIILLRGTNVSNALKGIILPELEHATGEKFAAQKMYLNLVPFYVGVKNINVFDNDGKRLLSAASAKGYIGLSGLFTKEIIIKKIVIREPEILLARNELDQLINNIKRYLSEKKKMPFEVSIKSLAISGGAMTFKDNDMETVLKDMNVEATLSKTPRFQVSSTLVKLVKGGIPELRGSVRTEFSLKDKKIELKSFKFVSLDSEIKTSGNLWLDEIRGFLRAEADIFVDSVKRIFGLKNRGEGRIHAEGSVTFDNISSGFDRIFIDLKLRGDVYLETLMELLKVKEELRGHVEFDGDLKGYLNDLTGSGKAKLIDGDIFGVDVDKLDCKLNYKDGLMRFEEGNAHLYNGSAGVEAQLKLPIVDYFSFKVVAKDVSSKGVVKLIKWDPHIPEGKISGEIASSGNAFNPHGSFIYSNTTTGKDVLGRIQEIKGDFSMKEDLIDFKNILVSTGKSHAVANGSVNLRNNSLNLVGNGTASNAADLSAPYFTGIAGPGELSFLVSGTFEDPLIDLTFKAIGAHFSTASLSMPSMLKDQVISFDAIEGTVTYRKNLLTLKTLSARSSKEEFKATGRIFFPNAHTLFELAGPEYDLHVTGKNMSVKELAGSFSGAPPLNGTLNAGFKLEGKPEDISLKGDFSAEGLTLYDIYSADHLDGKLSYEKRSFAVSNMNITKGATVLQVNGKLFLDKRFAFEAKSKKVNFLEVVPEKYRQLLQSNSLEDVTLTELRVRGDGTLESPNIEIASIINGGTYRAYSIGTGDIQGMIKGKQVNLLAHLFDSKVVVRAEGTLSERLPWSLVVDMQPGRYDFLLAKFIKDVPEDLLVNLKGTIIATGDKTTVDGAVQLDNVNLTMYGNSLTNTSPVIIKLKDKRLVIEKATLNSEATEFNLAGNISIGRSYDLTLKGSSSLAPLKAFSKSLEVLKGNAIFDLSVSGGWNSPEFNGNLTLSEGTIGFKAIPYRLTSVSAYLFFDGDKIVIKSANGKVSGGAMTASGSANLKGFSIKRFFVESHFKDITAPLRKDFWITFDGSIYYQGDLASQNLSGEIDVKKARYTERIDWRSWLLKVRLKERPKREFTKIDATNLNIKVVAPNVQIDNNLARASLSVDILMKGTLGQPIPLGKVETKDGTVYFRYNEFSISKARIDFTDPTRINPYIDLIAETKVDPYNITLTLNGFIDSFNLSFSSSPYLNNTDIVSLLTAGYIGSQTKTGGGGLGASEAAAFLAGKLQGTLDERLRTVAGIDKIAVEPYVTRKTATVTPRVSVSKKVGDNVYVTYATTVGQAQGTEQLWKIEYKLDKNISLVGIRDELGGLGADVKYRFEFK